VSLVADVTEFTMGTLYFGHREFEPATTGFDVLTNSACLRP
jgi:hypothetical protein